MSDFIIANEFGIFIFLEVMSLLFLLVFLFVRYAMAKQKWHIVLFFLFILCIVFEALLALFIFKSTGQIETIQVVIMIFIVYACTFGIADFKKLDRYIKMKVGNWRGINLLTEKELYKMKQNKDPKVTASKNRRWWYMHALTFIVALTIFWLQYGDHSHNLIYYLSDLSWWSEDGIANSPFRNEAIHQVSMIWIIIFALDTIISWSYTFFPSKEKG